MSQTTTCRTCGASLAPDQRYCLSCGTRVTAPRLDFVTELERAEPLAVNGHDPAAAATATQAAAPSTAAAGAPAPAPSRLDKVGGPMGAAAVVLVALGIGFLIGESGNDPVAQRAPVVNIQGSGVGGGTTPGTTDTPATDPTTAGDASSRGGNSRDTARRRAAADAQRVIDSTRDIPTTDTEGVGGDINRLRQLPDEVATPGAPPPRDNRPAGGGSRAETIG
jgi:hypothetical protein